MSAPNEEDNHGPVSEELLDRQGQVERARSQQAAKITAADKRQGEAVGDQVYTKDSGSPGFA